MKKTVLILITLILGCLFTSQVKADDIEGGVSSYSPTITPQEGESASSNVTQITGIQNINPFGSPLVFSSYNVTQVTLVYSEAFKYGVEANSVDIRHYETQSPSRMTATLSGVASYALSFYVGYESMVNQTVTLTITSGDSQVTTLPLEVYNEGFRFDIIVITSIQPHYPEPKDVWEYGSAEQQELLWNITQRYEEQQRTDKLILYVIGGVVAVLAVTLVLTFRHFRKKDESNINFRRRMEGR